MQKLVCGLAASESVARGLIVLVFVSVLGFVFETFWSDAPLLQELLYLLAGGALAYGALAHVLCHFGYVRRRKNTRSLETSVPVCAERRIGFGALIPAFKEEPEFVYRAMLSVALQRTEDKWLRLLIDDPPHPQTSDDKRLLDSARALPDRVSDFLLPLEAIARSAQSSAREDASQAIASLRKAHRRLSIRFARLARDWPSDTPEDRFFRTTVLARLALDHAGEADSVPDDHVAPLEALARLRARFVCDTAAFERKSFINLSHAANKAMNLNTGIDLIGKRVAAVGVGREAHLSENAQGEVLFPESEFLITLDADSLLAPAYADTLLSIASASNADDVAVVQTPYASLPEPATSLERVAGATTDVQRLIHQGFSYFNAAFWVGANAVLRLDALRDIALADTERGHPIRRYIQDRTPIEDTESTIDLALKGWRVVNHDAVLAWSATPADFGALVIQRRRWACGGLIVLPKAIRAAVATNQSHSSAFLQLLIRGHYLGSLFWCPAALLVLLFGPFEPSLSGIFLPLIAVPYFVAYLFDLNLSRRPFSELIHVYGFNLLLIPVNLAGALASLRQTFTGVKVPFARTPKIGNRTASPVNMLVAIWCGASFLAMSAGFDSATGNGSHAVFAGSNALAILIAAFAFVGWRATREDVRVGLRDSRARLRHCFSFFWRRSKNYGAAANSSDHHLLGGTLETTSTRGL